MRSGDGYQKYKWIDVRMDATGCVIASETRRSAIRLIEELLGRFAANLHDVLEWHLVQDVELVHHPPNGWAKAVLASQRWIRAVL